MLLVNQMKRKEMRKTPRWFVERILSVNILKYNYIYIITDNTNSLRLEPY